MITAAYTPHARQFAGGANALPWGGLPFMVAVCLQGFPIGRELTESTLMLDVDRYAILAEQVTAPGYTQTIIPLLIWSALYVVAASLVLMQRPWTTLKVIRKQWPLSMLLILVLSSALWSPNTAKVTTTFVHALGALFMALAAAYRYRFDPTAFVGHLAHVLSAVLLVHVLAVILIPNVAINYDNRWLGLFPNANTLGAAAFCSVWANGAAMMARRGVNRGLHCIGLILCAIALIGSASLTSMVASGICLLLIILFFHIHFRSHFAPIVFLILHLTCVLTSVALLFGLDIIIESFTTALGRSADLTGRVFLWLQAIDLINQKPWLGWGFDDHARVILETGMPHTTYHNGYLDLAVRGGLLAVGLFVATLAVYLKSILKSSRKEIFGLSLPFVIAMLVFNISEVSFAATRNLIWMIFLALLLLSLPILDRYSSTEWLSRRK